MSADISRQQRKERYHAVLRTVGHQTSPVQLPGARPGTITLILSGHGKYTADGISSAIRAAIEQHDLFGWRGPNGYRRLTPATVSDLRRLAEYLGEVMVDQRQLQRVNRAIEEVRD